MFTLETPAQVYARVALTNRLQHLDALRREAQADANAHLAAARLFHKCADDMVKSAQSTQSPATRALPCALVSGLCHTVAGSIRYRKQTMIVTTRINRNHVRAALVTAAKADIRGSLNGLLIEVHHNRTFIVSTDGLRVSVLRDDGVSGIATPTGGAIFIMPLALAEKVKANKQLSTIGLRYDTETLQITLDDCGDVSGAKASDGKYPDWRRVFPSNPDGVVANFNTAFVGDLGKLAKALCLKASSPIIWHNGKSAAWITITGAPEFRGAMMPLRVETTMPNITGFFDAPEYAPELIAA